VADERLSVATPEHVAVEYEVAGLGSRFAAALVDGFIHSALLAILVGGLVALGSLSCDPLIGAMERHTRGEPDALAHFLSGRFMAVLAVSLFAVQVLYHAAFEALRDGQTPGKRLLGIRVVRGGGYPVSAVGAIVRNLLRPVDFLPVFFGLGLVVALVTSRTQRLGDLAAGTLVVRERAGELAETLLPPLPAPAAGSVAATLTAAERELVQGFLDRRDGFDAPARARLAGRLAAGLRRRHGDLGAPELPAERYLERLAAERGA
jgi:uncharacterized RDD family membrane protein YckC